MFETGRKERGNARGSATKACIALFTHFLTQKYTLLCTGGVKLFLSV